MFVAILGSSSARLRAPRIPIDIPKANAKSFEFHLLARSRWSLGRTRSPASLGWNSRSFLGPPCSTQADVLDHGPTYFAPVRLVLGAKSMARRGSADRGDHRYCRLSSTIAGKTNTCARHSVVRPSDQSRLGHFAERPQRDWRWPSAASPRSMPFAAPSGHTPWPSCCTARAGNLRPGLPPKKVTPSSDLRITRSSDLAKCKVES